MNAARFDSKEDLGYDWARDAASAPALHESHPIERTADRSSWPHVLLRAVGRAAIGLTLLSAIPMGLVANRSALFIPNMSHLQAKTAEADTWREFRAPIDASITPQAAGDALRRIASPRPHKDYPMRTVSATHARPWNSITLTPDMFVDMRTPQYKGPAAFMLIGKTPAGYSAREMAYLREVAEAPFWKDFDAVAHARQVDLVGGLFETPFQSDASLMALPTIGFADSKQVAYAAVSRATYYLASGNPAEAERVLRNVVSFGFTFIDQGVSAIDAMIGRVIVDIGRDGLYHLYMQTGRGDLAVKIEPIVRVRPTAPSQRPSPAPFNEEATRAAAIALIGNPNAPRTLRLEAMEMLSYGGSCGSVRTMLTGPSGELRATLASARSSMARFPSEQAFFDLLERTMERGPKVTRDAGVLARVASGTAEVLSAITGNERIATCTKLASTIQLND